MGVQIVIIDRDKAAGAALRSWFLLRREIEHVTYCPAFSHADEHCFCGTATIAILDADFRNRYDSKRIIQIKKRNPDARIVIHTTAAEPWRVFQAFSCGADGYLIKPVQTREWPAILDLIIKGGHPLSPPVCSILIQALRTFKGGWLSADKIFSRGELKVIKHLIAGRRDKEIAELLGIHPVTVHAYTGRIFRKLEVHSRKEASLIFMRWFGPMD